MSDNEESREPVKRPAPQIDPLVKIFAELDDEIKNRPPEPPMPTGIVPLDKLIWGVHKQELMVLGGRPGEGKTSLALYMAYNMAKKGIRVLFLSLEMTKYQLLERIFCHVCDLDAWQLRTGQKPEDYEKKAEIFAKLLPELKLYIVDQWGYSFDEVKSLFTRFKKESKPDVIILDYIQLLTFDPRLGKRGSIDEYLRSLKELTIKHDVATIVLSQLHRGAAAKAKKPGVADFKESGGLEEAADCAALVWWKTMDEEVDPNKTQYYIIIGKQRNGPQGDVEIAFHPWKFRFRENPEVKW